MLRQDPLAVALDQVAERGFAAVNDELHIGRLPANERLLETMLELEDRVNLTIVEHPLGGGGRLQQQARIEVR